MIIHLILDPDQEIESDFAKKLVTEKDGVRYVEIESILSVYTYHLLKSLPVLAIVISERYEYQSMYHRMIGSYHKDGVYAGYVTVGKVTSTGKYYMDIEARCALNNIDMAIEWFYQIANGEIEPNRSTPRPFILTGTD